MYYNKWSLAKPQYSCDWVAVRLSEGLNGLGFGALDKLHTILMLSADNPASDSSYVDYYVAWVGSVAGCSLETIGTEVGSYKPPRLDLPIPLSLSMLGLPKIT
jgi:hypothetical protein